MVAHRRAGTGERRRRWVSVVAAAMLVLAANASAKQSHLVIIVGLGGEDSYREKFHQWASDMRDAAIQRYGVSPETIYYLAEKPELYPDIAHAKSTKENVADVFAALESSVAPGDQLFILLIGHGSFRSEESRFNLPGPDLTAVEFDLMLQPFSGQQIVFVNASSASGSFLPVLAGPNRIVVTATKSGYERNESLFGEYFVEAYAGDGADTDKNERISVLEAFNHARVRVDGYYNEENILKTEHAILDDNGDGEGAHDPGEDEGDIAATVYLQGDAAVAEGFSEADPLLCAGRCSGPLFPRDPRCATESAKGTPGCAIRSSTSSSKGSPARWTGSRPGAMRRPSRTTMW